MAYLYRHIRLDKNEVFYIGIGSYQKKWKYARAYTTKNRNKHWKNIVTTCNGEFKVEIILDNLSKEEASNKEKEFILIYGRQDLNKGTLCNFTDGGEGVNGIIFSQEVKDAMSKTRKGKKVLSDEHYNMMRTRMSGSNNHNYGKPLPEWHKAINRKAQLGRKHSQETIQKRTSQIKKKVKNLDTGMIFQSISDCAKYYNKSACHMTRLIKQGVFNLKFI